MVELARTTRRRHSLDVTQVTNSLGAAKREPEAEGSLDRNTDENGVDLTLIRASLALTPTERLKSLENALNVLATVQPSNR